MSPPRALARGCGAGRRLHLNTTPRQLSRLSRANPGLMHYALCTAYFAVLLVLAMYGLHRSHLVLTVLRHRRTLRGLKEGVPALAATAIHERNDLPHVTVQ